MVALCTGSRGDAEFRTLGVEGRRWFWCGLRVDALRGARTCAPGVTRCGITGINEAESVFCPYDRRVCAMRCNSVMRNGNIGTEKFMQTALSHIPASARNASVISPSLIHNRASKRAERRARAPQPRICPSGEERECVRGPTRVPYLAAPEPFIIGRRLVIDALLESLGWSSRIPHWFEMRSIYRHHSSPLV